MNSVRQSIDELKQKAFSRGISNFAEGNFEILINLTQFFKNLY